MPQIGPERLSLQDAVELLARVRANKDIFNALRHNILVKGVHYANFGGKKDTLLKAGAVEIIRALGLTPEFAEMPIGCIVDPDNHLYASRYMCHLLDSEGKVVCGGSGSAISTEDNFAYQWVNEKKMFELGIGLDAMGVVEKNGMYRILHQDPGVQFNAVDKMAQIRALTQAVLFWVGAGWTQDWGDEDLEHIFTLDPNHRIRLEDLVMQFTRFSLKDLLGTLDIADEVFEMCTPESGRELLLTRCEANGIRFYPTNVARKVSPRGVEYWRFELGIGEAITKNTSSLQPIIDAGYDLLNAKENSHIVLSDVSILVSREAGREKTTFLDVIESYIG